MMKIWSCSLYSERPFLSFYPIFVLIVKSDCKVKKFKFDKTLNKLFVKLSENPFFLRKQPDIGEEELFDAYRRMKLLSM